MKLIVCFNTSCNRCYRCDFAHHDYDVLQQHCQGVIGELCASSATSYVDNK